MAMQRLIPDPQWAQAQVEPFGGEWQRWLIGRWKRKHRASRRMGNLGHLRSCTQLRAVHTAGLSLGDRDAEIVKHAHESARDAERRIGEASAPFRGCEVLKLSAGLWAVEGWLHALGLSDAWERVSKSSFGRTVLARVRCEYWWRAVLRRVHGRATEGVARAIGMVSKSEQPYASDVALAKRKGMNFRNAKMMDGTILTNEYGQQFEMSKLAAKSPASKDIRRCELMTRIAGFELLARDCGHVAYFLTVTTPSRMHAYRTRHHSRWDAVPNAKHDGTKPDEAQRYLTKQWERCRSTMARAGLGLYGFRIAEPNHDGTPHWHMLFFMPRDTDKGVPSGLKLWELMRRYFLCNEGGDGEERGAAKHRVTIKAIDWEKGSAAGYVAKYISKNIDGHAIEKDLLGNDAVTCSQRVDAWASTWGIRQFQQIGGAPVGVWRELRRLHPDQAAGSEVIAQALDAVNITADRDPNASDIGKQKTAAHGWHGYTVLQGGSTVRRKDLRVKLMREQTGEVGRYGDVIAPRVVGVVAESVDRVVTPSFGIVPALTTVRRMWRAVESERCTWVVSTKAGAPAALARVLALAGSEAARPWSPVNNCTRPSVHPEPLFAAAVQRVPKKGRFSKWNRGRSTTKEEHHVEDQGNQHPPDGDAGRGGHARHPGKPH